MQASSAWAPPVGTLGRILGEAERRVEGLRLRQAELERAAAASDVAPSLAASLRRGNSVAVLAEVKRSSPSMGAINPGLDAVAQARAYQAGGALGISVLTEPAHFGGSNGDLEAIRGAVGVPLLKKDFHVHPLQLVEARALGASAVLLIARALAPGRLVELVAEAAALWLEVLVEVRDERELERALETPAALVGVNNRNLETLAIDAAVSDRLIPAIPADRVAIAESGMRTVADVARAAAAGADAVLVGSSISAAGDPVAAVRELAGVPRGSR